MANLAIKGHATRGKEVIEILEMLGGNRPKPIFDELPTHQIYYIRECDKAIVSATYTTYKDMFQVYTLEEFLKKYPYKVGDEVLNVQGTVMPCQIKGMYWDNDCIKYYCEGTIRKGECFDRTAEELQPYKEETMDEENKAVFDANAQCCDIMNHIIKGKTMEEITMSTDDILQKLPNIIGNHRFNDCYILVSPTDQIGHLCLVKDKKCWIASYMDGEHYVCLNPEDKQPPYNNAVAYGDVPNEALQKLYDWCVKNGFIK